MAEEQRLPPGRYVVTVRVRNVAVIKRGETKTEGQLIEELLEDAGLEVVDWSVE